MLFSNLLNVRYRLSEIGGSWFEKVPVRKKQKKEHAKL